MVEVRYQHTVFIVNQIDRHVEGSEVLESIEMNFTSATIDYVKLDSFIIARKDSQVGEVNIFEENLLIVKKRNT